MVWSGVRQLHTFGFTVLLICCDGAASNYMGVSSVATNSVSRHSVAIDSCSTSLLLAAVLSRASKGLAVEPYKEPTTAVDMHVDGEAFSSGGTCVQGLQLVCCVASAHSPRACLAISNTVLTTYPNSLLLQHWVLLHTCEDISKLVHGSFDNVFSQ
eukprot:scpid84839/ scgid25854/ 